MGDRIEIEAIEFISSINTYQVDLYNATKDEHFRVFIPEPKTKLEKIVHLVDYIASRRYVEIKIEEK